MHEAALADPGPAHIGHDVGGVNPCSLWHGLLPTQTWVGFNTVENRGRVCLLHKKRATPTRGLHVGFMLRGDDPVVSL